MQEPPPSCQETQLTDFHFWKVDAGLRQMLASPAGRVREVDEPNLPDPNFELVGA